MRRWPTLTVAALLSVGVLVLHDLRYLIAFGDDAATQSVHDGHGYLAFVTPLVALLAAVAAARFLLGLASARPAHRAWDARVVWLTASATLLAIYSGQELVEGWLAPGHPAGVAAVLGHGGWTAIPLALALGSVIALVLRGAHRLQSRPLVRIPRPSPAIPPAVPTRAGVTVRRRPLLLSGLAAGRAPPARAT